jgi:hypothetical protein
MATDEMEKILTRMKKEWGANDRKSLPGDGMAHSPVTFYLLLSYLLPPEGRPRPFTFYFPTFYRPKGDRLHHVRDASLK